MASSAWVTQETSSPWVIAVILSYVSRTGDTMTHTSTQWIWGMVAVLHSDGQLRTERDGVTESKKKPGPQQKNVDDLLQ